MIRDEVLLYHSSKTHRIPMSQRSRLTPLRSSRSDQLMLRSLTKPLDPSSPAQQLLEATIGLRSPFSPDYRRVNERRVPLAWYAIKGSIPGIPGMVFQDFEEVTEGHMVNAEQ